MAGWKLKLEPRKQEAGLLLQVLYGLAGLLAAFAIVAVLIRLSGASVGRTLLAIGRGAFGGWDSLLETLVQTTPLIFTGLAVVVAFRGRVWNIGAEGQFYAGAMAATWVGLRLGGLPPSLHVPLLILASLAAGALWGGIPGLLKSLLGTNEIIVTVMMNYIILYLLSFLLGGPWQEPGQAYMQTAPIAKEAFFPVLLRGSRLHLGFPLALLSALLVYALLWKTPAGFEIRAIGVNPVAARYKGIDMRRVILLVMLVSGAIAGLAGGSEIAGIHQRLRHGISIGYGYTGILIALLGRLHPVGVILAAAFFGVLINGSTAMQIFVGVPVALVYSVQGVVLICLLVAEVFSRHQLRRV